MGRPRLVGGARVRLVDAGPDVAHRRTAQQAGAPVRLVDDRRKKAMADRIVEACGGSVAGRTVAVLGVTFKPNTDDMRDAPSLDVVPALLAAGATVRAYDPVGMEQAARLMPGVDWAKDAYACMAGADCVAILTEWNEFRALDLERVAGLLARPVMIDLRNIYKPAEMREAGFEYHSIGRPFRAGALPTISTTASGEIAR